MGFLVLAGFFSVLLRPAPQAGPAGEPPSIAAAAYPRVAPVAETKPLPVPVPENAAPQLATPAQPPAAPSPVAPSLPNKKIGPRVAILVANLGMNSALTSMAIADLPAEISLGFSPYGSDLARLAAAGRSKGHDIWVGIPMQPRRYPAIDPGKNTLLVSASAAENIRRFDWALAQVPGPRAGFYNMMGSAFTANGTALLPVLQAAARQPLLFLDTKSGGDTLGPKVAATAGLRAALAVGFLDDTPAQLPDRLSALVQAAKTNGTAIGLVEPRAETFATLVSWRATLADAGVDLVSVSAAIAP
jgi:uncharacterized protein